MNTEWNKLRAFNGDVKHGFEELVCQLARAEHVPDKAKFIRVAAPDGGVEAYCILTNGNEYGWQAKFFSSMGDSQWTQIDKSFKTAFAKHPNLKKYYVCTPLDRQDPRIANEKWFMDKWKEKVTDWEAFSTASERTIEFVYWGNSELFERLSRKENEGKLYFWFEQEEFSDDWFNHRLQESIRNLDKRYTPELNFDLPIAKVFEGIARDKNFYSQFNLYLDDLLKNFNKAVSHNNETKVKNLVDKTASIVAKFRHECEQINFIEITLIDNVSLTSLLEEVRQIIDSLIHQFNELDLASKNEKKAKQEYVSVGNIYGWEIDSFRKLNNSICEFIEFINGSTVLLSNNPCMLLTGDAGRGKSHLLADVAVKRSERNQFSVLLLGQHFTEEEPWSQIKKLLHLNCNRDKFLSALNAKAETTDSRILILIDAINEGEGKKNWKNYIASFITVVKKFPNLGVVFSVRTSYEKLIIPESLTEKNEVVKVIHHGFSHHEYEASKHFFEYYGIKQPSIPLLHPEFSNPLFLKLFCEGLYKKGLNEIPVGYEGISTILNFYLEAINNKISEKYKLPENLNITQKVVEKIASQIADTENTYIKFDDAYATITHFAKDDSIAEPSQFFVDLIREGLLTTNVYWERMGNHFEGVYFSYERFSDHLVCSYLLKNHFDKKNPTNSFVAGNKLHKLLEDNNTAYYNQGMIEALSIQLPELVGIELFEAAPHAKEFDVVAQTFVESIIWRKKESIHEKLNEYIKAVVIKKHGLHEFFLNTILLVTSHPNHYFNSDFLHHHLIKFSMSDRDSWWTQYIHNQYPGYSHEASPIKRMIDWAWSDDKRENISDESIRLMCQTMIWFLTSTNRTLRDSATKAIICLLEERINVLMELIKTFEVVNDPYVLQRIYAIAYGCAVRTSNTEILKDLGDLIFQKVFATEKVIPDILLRDYAKGIIEFAVFKGHIFDFDLEKIQPPFKSDLPASLPTNEEISSFKLKINDEYSMQHKKGQNYILNSMALGHGMGNYTYGDFGKYVFERGLSKWRVDVNGLCNLAIKWIIEKYGYAVEKHGEFDRKIGSGRARNYKNKERIGKKYQWIAFYEILARVCDNYPFYEDSFSDDAKLSKYKGTWKPFVRDIDPTITINDNTKVKSKSIWWNTFEYSNWNIEPNDWLTSKENLPNPQNLLCVFDEQSVEWLVLKMYFEWNEPVPLGEEGYEYPHKSLSYDLNSHIVNKKDLQKFIESLKNINLKDCDLSDSQMICEMYSREYYWAAANRTFRTDFYGGNQWDEFYNRKSKEYICKTARTTVQYLWEVVSDASQEEPLSFYKPTEFLFGLLDLQYSNVEGELLNQSGEMICFDPSGNIQANSCLLVRKADLLKVLNEKDLEIVWTSFGDKLMKGSNIDRKGYNGRLNILDVMYFDLGNLKSFSQYEQE